MKKENRLFGKRTPDGLFFVSGRNRRIMDGMQSEHKQYIAEYGQDLEEVRNWEWH
ncbi:MAG: hypothetical protein SOT28_12855 [Fusicatenibacter sp.]|nr:hypothetical protein [Lachnospiraceae bacterium]MDY2939173.1 hypothetical protein [Fusicatenibacter sp.]